MVSTLALLPPGGNITNENDLMETTNQWLQVLGLAVILTFATVILVRGVTLTIRGKHHEVRFGMEMLIVFTVLYLFAHHALRLAGLSDYIAPVENVVIFLWWISLAFTINASLNRFVWAGILSDNGERKIPKLLTDGAALLLYAGAVMMVMHYAYGKSITAILATSGAAAFIVGLSAQSTLREVFAGLSLNMTRALRLGDFVEIDGIYGKVHEINWRSVSLLSPNTGSLYLFPNSAVADKIILNFSEPTELFKYWVKFTVEHSASPDLVISTITEGLQNSRYVCRDPKPDFNILGFSDLGMEYRVRFYFDGDDPWWDAQNEVCMAIWSSLRQKGIRLSIDRHKLLSGDEQDSNPWNFDNLIQPDDDLRDAIASNSFFAMFSSEHLEKLVSSARYIDYTPPDCIFGEGDPCDAVYYITDGDFSVLQTQSDGSEAQIGTRQSGECIGLEYLVEETDSDRDSTIRAERYSGAFQLDVSLLREMIAETESAKEAIKNVLQKQYDQQQQFLKQHAETIAKTSRAEHHAIINLHVREHVEDIFSKPLLHRFLHVLSPATVERDLLEAMMAACALIASARGEIDDVESEFLRENFASIDLFKHVEVDESLKLFERDLQNIGRDEKRGTHAAIAKIRAISNEPELAHIVMGIAHGMTDLHGELLDLEQERILQIAEVLHLSSEIEDLADRIKR